MTSNAKKFTYDPRADTITMPAKWWRAVAHTHECKTGEIDPNIRYITPKNALERDLSDLFLLRLFPADEVDELFALFGDPHRGTKPTPTEGTDK